MATALTDSCAALDELRDRVVHDFFSNTLLLCHTAPYLSVADILHLSATCRSLRWIIQDTPQMFRRLDLTDVKSAQFDIDGIDHGGETWRNVQLDENLTEDDFYSGPLRGIFSSLNRRSILAHVQTLILDGLSVTSDLCHDIIADPAGIFNVRILSIREVRNLNEGKLQQALRYACRPTRPLGSPRLKGLYIFGPKDGVRSALWSTGAENETRQLGGPNTQEGTPGQRISTAWNNRSHSALRSSLASHDGPSPANWCVAPGVGGPIPGLSHNTARWAPTMAQCRRIIAFDAVLCTSWRHAESPVFDASHVPHGRAPLPAVAIYSLGGCARCGSAPEGLTEWGMMLESPDRVRLRDNDGGTEDYRRDQAWEVGRFPLLAPLPSHSSSIRAAMCPPGETVPAGGERMRKLTGESDAPKRARFVPRCATCLLGRYCVQCRRWWCEACFPGPGMAETADGPQAGDAAAGEGETTASVSASENSQHDQSSSAGPMQPPVWHGLCRERCATTGVAELP